MKKLILLALVAIGIGVVVKSKSEQIKSGAAKVTSDPRVQSALATAAPVAETVKERLHKGDDLTPPAVPAEAEEVAVTDPVSAPEFSGEESDSVAPEPTPAPGRPAPTGDPLTDPLPPEDTRG